MFRLSTTIPKQIQKALFPPVCPICKQLLDSQQPDDGGCCPDCLNHIQIIGLHACRQCGASMPPSLTPGPCGKCLTHPPPQQSTLSLYRYKGAVRSALLAWKLQGDSAGTAWLLEAARERIQQTFSPQDLLIPVPMPISRMRRSGLHHSADLCKSIARITGAQTDWQILRRKGNDIRQSALKGRARKNNLRKAFTLADDYRIKLDAYPSSGKTWVIDDILTTGATLRHACRTMKHANRPVHAFTLARTQFD